MKSQFSNFTCKYFCHVYSRYLDERNLLRVPANLSITLHAVLDRKRGVGEGIPKILREGAAASQNPDPDQNIDTLFMTVVAGTDARPKYNVMQDFC